MAEVAVIPIAGGWRVTEGEVTIDAQTPNLRDGVVRVARTVRKDDTEQLVDRVNLTSQRARQRVVSQLDQKGVPVAEAVLIALERACRASSAEPERANLPRLTGAQSYIGDDLVYALRRGSRCVYATSQGDVFTEQEARERYDTTTQPDVDARFSEAALQRFKAGERDLKPGELLEDLRRLFGEHVEWPAPY
jgi:hypothetical protein